MDCGAACLAMVTRAFGRRVSLARIRQLVNTGLDGTSLRSICRAGEELGLATRSVKTSARHLDQHAASSDRALGRIPLDRAGRRRSPATFRSSIRRIGRRRLTREEFERRWSGYAALFDYTPAFEQAPQSTRMLAWMWPLVRPHVGLLLQALGLAVVVSVLQMVLPVFTQVIVDRVLVDQDLSLLHLLIVAMGATMCFIVAVAAAAALSAELLGGADRCGGARLPHPATAGAAACRTSPRGGPATCSVASKASARCAISSCSTASPALPPSPNWPRPWR